MPDPSAHDRNCAGVATAYRCTAEVEFSDYCPCMVVDTPLAGNALTYMTELLGKGAMDMTPLTGGKPREQGTLRLHAVREPRQQARPGFLLRIFHSRQCGAPMDVRLGQAGGSSGDRMPSSSTARMPGRYCPASEAFVPSHREGRFELSARKTGYACTHNNGGDPRRPPKLNPTDRREVPHRRAPGRPPNDARSPSLPGGMCGPTMCSSTGSKPNRWAA